MDYDLSRLSWRSFEQLIQGIGTEVLGSGLVVFGDGPDGGREATINADISYPTTEDPWRGYTVVQAKFLQRPQNVTSDGRWAIGQLRNELSKYLEDGTTRTLPDNMIFATNVTLSPGKDTGAKDRIFELAREAGIEQFDVWDYDKIRVFLDKYKDLRRSFAPYVLAGDVLAEMMEAIEEIKAERPDFDAVMSRFLQKELIADQWVNLEQAGRSTEEQVPVSRVFVDLPVSEVRQADSPIEDSNDLEPGFVAQILETATMRLDSEAHPQLGDQNDVSSREARVVLVGGPGQGKTTIGQFVCQMFRAALLRSRESKSLAPEVKDALAALERHCASDGSELPPVRRFPLRIELTKFADELGDSDGCASLLAYIAKLISMRVNEEISPSLMSSWLRHYPWLLILDGLDEVPASGNRKQLMAAIRDFWIDIAGATADCLVIATTRPQGYEDEFSPSYYRHVYLTPLSTARALHYADRLLRVRFSTDADRRSEIASRLSRAAARSDTGRLMTSPLQVTIMATLLERMGQPPEGRWNLFSQYYRVIYDRELEREIAAAWVLRDHRPDIDAIHKRVGLLLQSEGETASQAEGQISRERFAEVVRARLREEELDGDESLVAQIIDAAMERLVFLVPVEADHVGFEIRSLQEFMAAEALLDGREKIVETRLRTIAPLSAWRNVFLFAAGRCFTDLQHYRDTINTICGELNDPATHPLAPLVLPGSSLAIDLLSDGVANRQTKYERLLSREALRIARCPPGELSDRLAEIYLPQLRSTFESELREAVSGDVFSESLGAWRTLAVLLARGEDWAQKILEKHLPSERELGQLLEALPRHSKSPWLSETLASLCAAAPPLQSLPFHEELKYLDIATFAPPWYQIFLSLTSARLGESSEAGFDVEGVPSDLLSVSLRMIGKPTGPMKHAVSALDVDERTQAPASWEVLFSNIEFLQSPSPDVLAQIFDRLADVNDPDSLEAYAAYTGWPLSSLLLSANGESRDLDKLAELVRAGEFGDESSWIKAQERWENGIALVDFSQSSDLSMPFDRDIADRGFPLSTATITVDSDREATTVALSWLEHITHPKTRQFVTNVLFWVLRRLVYEGDDLPVKFDQLAGAVRGSDLKEQRILPFSVLNAFTWSGALDKGNVDLLEALSLRFEEIHDSEEAIASDLRERLLESLGREEERPGLLRLLAIGLHYSPEESREQLEELVTSYPGSEAASARALLAIKLERESNFADLSALTEETDAWITDAIGAIRHMGDGGFSRTLFGAVAEALAPDRWKPKRDLISAAASLIGSKPSGLAAAQTWNSLELFGRVANDAAPG